MRIRLASSLLLLALGGCHWPFLLKEPFNAQCEAECFKECAEPVTLALPRMQSVTADEAIALVKLDGELVKSQAQVTKDQMKLCETRRSLCASCLTRLKTAKVIQ